MATPNPPATINAPLLNAVAFVALVTLVIPDTANEVKVPTDVTFGCAAVAIVP